MQDQYVALELPTIPEGPTGAPLDDAGTFKFWRIQKPNAVKLIKEIIFRWRGASAFVRGKPGKWVVWPRERWCEWTGLSRNQLDRALKELVDSGMIDRERHRFAGSEVRTFLRPTVVALKYLGRPQDMAKVAPTSEKLSDKSTEKAAKEINEKVDEKINEKTDYTSIPSIANSSKISTCTTEQTEAPMPLDKEGKGSAGEDDEEGQIEKMMKELTATKQKTADKLFPEKQGPHQKYVKHPSKMYDKWLSFSVEAKVNSYQKYLTYVENWYNGKKGKGFTSYGDEWTEGDDAAFFAAMKDMSVEPEESE